MAKVFYLVRHGEYHSPPERLTNTGIQQSKRAGEELQSLGIGPDSVVLSSSAPRTMQTARIIREAVNATREVIASDYLKEIGLSGFAPDNIAELVLRATNIAEINLENGIVIVLHQPSLIALSNQPYVKHCEIIAKEIKEKI